MHQPDALSTGDAACSESMTAVTEQVTTLLPSARPGAASKRTRPLSLGSGEWHKWLKQPALDASCTLTSQDGFSLGSADMQDLLEWSAGELLCEPTSPLNRVGNMQQAINEIGEHLPPITEAGGTGGEGTEPSGGAATLSSLDFFATELQPFLSHRLEQRHQQHRQRFLTSQGLQAPIAEQSVGLTNPQGSGAQQVSLPFPGLQAPVAHGQRLGPGTAAGQHDFASQAWHTSEQLQVAGPPLTAHSWQLAAASQPVQPSMWLDASLPMPVSGPLSSDVWPAPAEERGTDVEIPAVDDGRPAGHGFMSQGSDALLWHHQLAEKPEWQPATLAGPSLPAQEQQSHPPQQQPAMVETLSQASSSSASDLSNSNAMRMSAPEPITSGFGERRRLGSARGRAPQQSQQGAAAVGAGEPMPPGSAGLPGNQRTVIIQQGAASRRPWPPTRVKIDIASPAVRAPCDPEVHIHVAPHSSVSASLPGQLRGPGQLPAWQPAASGLYDIGTSAAAEPSLTTPPPRAPSAANTSRTHTPVQVSGAAQWGGNAMPRSGPASSTAHPMRQLPFTGGQAAAAALVTQSSTSDLLDAAFQSFAASVPATQPGLSYSADLGMPDALEPHASAGAGDALLLQDQLLALQQRAEQLSGQIAALRQATSVSQSARAQRAHRAQQAQQAPALGSPIGRSDSQGFGSDASNAVAIEPEPTLDRSLSWPHRPQLGHSAEGVPLHDRSESAPTLAQDAAHLMPPPQQEQQPLQAPLMSQHSGPSQRAGHAQQSPRLQHAPQPAFGLTGPVNAQVAHAVEQVQQQQAALQHLIRQLYAKGGAERPVAAASAAPPQVGLPSSRPAAPAHQPAVAQSSGRASVPPQQLPAAREGPRPAIPHAGATQQGPAPTLQTAAPRAGAVPLAPLAQQPKAASASQQAREAGKPFIAANVTAWARAQQAQQAQQAAVAAKSASAGQPSRPTGGLDSLMPQIPAPASICLEADEKLHSSDASCGSPARSGAKGATSGDKPAPDAQPGAQPVDDDLSHLDARALRMEKNRRSAAASRQRLLNKISSLEARKSNLQALKELQMRNLTATKAEPEPPAGGRGTRVTRHQRHISM